VVIESHEEHPTDEAVQAAAEHADRASEHRQEMQRRAAQADAADDVEGPVLEREAAAHRDAAESEEADAEASARDAEK
jgi:hypothetical protein